MNAQLLHIITLLNQLQATAARTRKPDFTQLDAIDTIAQRTLPRSIYNEYIMDLVTAYENSLLILKGDY